MAAYEVPGTAGKLANAEFPLAWQVLNEQVRLLRHASLPQMVNKNGVLDFVCQHAWITVSEDTSFIHFVSQPGHKPRGS